MMAKCKCGCDAKMHANPENHVLGTRHCTTKGCNCKDFQEKVGGK